jgi:hypothetical protein
MKVDWKRFSDELAEWEVASAHERYLKLCAALERAIRRAHRRDGLLDYGEVIGALDRVAEEVVRMRREAEGRKPGERIVLEVDAGLADRVRGAAQRAGLETGELLAALLDRQLLCAEPRERRRKRREE